MREPYEPIETRRRPENKLETVKRATLDILDRLTPADRFALVTYDDDIAVPIPSGNIEDVDRARNIFQNQFIIFSVKLKFNIFYLETSLILIFRYYKLH